MGIEPCGVCGGDGQMTNSFGNSARCPSCHGTGRRSDDGGMRDVTKTKPSHHRQPSRADAAPKQQWPSTFEGEQLAIQVRDCPSVSAETKAKLTLEIIEHESTHGRCTETFLKKIRKQVRPATG